MTRFAALGLAGLLVALGGWQVGAAGWIHAKAWLAQALLETAWQRTLATGAPAKPWPWADTWPVARLAAPAHGAELIVLAGGNGRTLAFAPGHLDGSPLPGRPGTSVIGGHRDTHFRFLERVRRGDELVVDDDAGVHRFRVTETRIVDSRTARIEPAGTRPALALVTCYPFDAIVPGGPLRYVVLAIAEDAPGG
jgi:sortase A